MFTARQALLFALLPIFAAGCALLDSRNGNDGENNTSTMDMGASTPDMTADEDMASPPNTMTPTDMNTTPPEDMGGGEDMAKETTPSIVSTFEVVEESTNHDGVGETCIAARCPAGKKLLGGGGVWFSGANITVNAQRNREEAWVICLTSDTSASFRTQALCAKTDEEIMRRADEVGIAKGQSGCVDVACDQPMLPISGGSTSSSGMKLTENRRRPDFPGRWQTCGTYEGTLDSKTFKASSLCIRGSANASATHNSGGHPGGSSPFCISASCGNDLLVGGGGRWDSDRVEITSSSLTDFNSWTLCGKSPERFGPSDDVWEVEAICLRNP